MWLCGPLEEEVCGYAFSTFKVDELNYQSSHKELLAVKKVIHHYKLYLKPSRFLVRTNLKIMPGMLKLKCLLTDSHSRIHKWITWIENFDFDIKYKP